jgi:hypothetical protein
MPSDTRFSGFVGIRAAILMLVHLYGDGTVQVSILYGCSLLVEWGTVVLIDQAIY